MADPLSIISSLDAQRLFLGAQGLLVDPAMQAGMKGKLLVIDEYGLLSSRDLKDTS